MEGHEDDEVPFESQLIEAPAARAVLVDPARERDDGMHVRQVVVAEVDEAEHQGPAVLVGRDRRRGC